MRVLQEDHGGYVPEVRNILFLVRPKMKIMKIIASHIRHMSKNSASTKHFYIYMIPRKTLICEHILETEGVLGRNVHVHEFELDLVPLDDDVISMEMEMCFRECFLEGDNSSLYYIARALMKMQTFFGLFPRISAKGRCAKQVAQSLLRMRKEVSGDALDSIPPEIHQLYLIDRDVDLISPFVTQLTYEGLVDEFWGIKTGVFELPEAIAAKREAAKQANAPKEQQQPIEQKKKVHKMALNGNDSVFVELRDKNFISVPAVLNQKAQAIAETENKRHTMKQVSEISNFIKKLPELQIEKDNLATHIEITAKIREKTTAPEFRKLVHYEQDLLLGAEEKSIQEYVEECINKNEDFQKVLRLLTLLSLVSNGLKPKQWDFFRKEIMQTYGYEAILTLDNMEKVGLLKKHEGKKTFEGIRKGFKLWVDDLDESNPNDIAYVYSGYAPLSVRLIQQAMQPGGWRATEGLINSLPGPMCELTQGQSSEGMSGNVRVVLIFFIGGCTFAEISALRFLNEIVQQSESDDQVTHFVICTTKLVNGRTLLETVCEKVGVLRDL
eukprot:TRINITY_DN51791_c0_g1_i1.p1 TRINITY_DN51791_c0_g1~~TRINITY_DN51791_c0_g1_i1.p1  ORF type:complete len:631 (-),score=70.58 TRINITY_DN51791_c0_g1_i1:50-1711(-)